MRTCRRLVYGLFAVGLLASGLPVQSQILIPMTNRPVVGEPYTALIQTDWDGSKDVPAGQSSSRELRDNAGRQRAELGSRPGSHIVIYDVVAGRIITLVPDQQVARITRMDVAVGSKNTRQPCAVRPGFQGLGSKQIAGLEACGQKREGSEVWHSVKYTFPLEIDSVQERGGRVRERVVTFIAAEPDPTLFEVPEGYRTEVVENKPDAAGVYEIGNGVSAPVVLYQPEPEFSEEARRKQMSGSVQVTLEVGEDGLPKNVRVTRGFGYGLDEAALNAVRQYKFKPALKDGVPVVVTLKVEVNFKVFRKP